MIIPELLKQKKYIFKEIIFILVISIFAGLLYNLIGDQQIPLSYHPYLTDNDKRLTFSEIKRIHKNKEALFVDARSVEDYNDGHIPDAINIPASMGRSQKLEMLNPLRKNLQIIVYCENPQCSLAERLAKEMQYLKFLSVTVYEGGWDEWNSRINSDSED